MRHKHVHLLLLDQKCRKLFSQVLLLLSLVKGDVLCYNMLGSITTMKHDESSHIEIDFHDTGKGADDVGYMQRIDEERTTGDATTKRTTKRDIEIYNLEGKHLSFALWNEMAKDFNICGCRKVGCHRSELMLGETIYRIATISHTCDKLLLQSSKFQRLSRYMKCNRDSYYFLKLQIGTSAISVVGPYTHRFSSKSHGRINGKIRSWYCQNANPKQRLLTFAKRVIHSLESKLGMCTRMLRRRLKEVLHFPRACLSTTRSLIIFRL